MSSSRLALGVGLAGVALIVAAGCSGSPSGQSPPDGGADDGGPTFDAGADVYAPGPDGGEAGSGGDAGDAGAADAGDAGDAAVFAFGDPTCATVSGSRLKQHWFVGPEGTRVFQSMYDTALSADCSFYLAADGSYRCYPISSSVLLEYADSSCMQPVMSQFGSCAVPPYWGTFFPGACGEHYAAYQVGAKQPAGQSYYQKSGTKCVPSTLPAVNDRYAVTAMPDSMFVSATRGKVTSGRFSMGTYEGADGSRECDSYVTPHDETLGVDTVLAAVTTDATARLVPNADPPGDFSDSACTSPATLVQPDACTGATPKYTAEYPDQCKAVATIRAIGAAIPGAYALNGTTCAAAPAAPAGASYDAVGAPLDPSTFAAVASQNTGTGRLQYQDHVTADGFRWRDGVYDSQTMSACWIPNGSSGTARCMPSDENASVWYSDSACTQELDLANVDPTCAPAGYPSATTRAWLNTCQPRIVHFGAQYTGVKYQKNGNQCNQADYPGQVFYRVVDDIDPTTFEQMTEVIE